MASISLLINNIEYRNYVDVTSLSVMDSMESSGDTCEFTLDLPIASLSSAPVPPVGCPVKLTWGTTVHFYGILGSAVNSRGHNAEHVVVRCSCHDFVPWLDSKLIATARPAEMAGARIKALCAYVNSMLGSFPFTTNNVDDGYLVAQEDYDYVSFSSVLNSLAETCHYMWYIDQSMDIHFIAEDTYKSPLPDNRLDLDTELAVGDVSLTTDISQIKNRIYVKGYSQKGTNEYADGPYTPGENQTFYKLSMPPFDVESARVVVNGEAEERLVRLDPLDGAQETIDGNEGEVLICTFNMGARFPLTDLPQQAFTVYYYPELPDRISMYEDIDSIRYFASVEGTSGVHEFLISVPDMKVESIDPIAAMGEYMLRRYAWPLITGSFVTYEIHGWKHGQMFRLHSTDRDIYDIPTYAKTGAKRDPLMFVVSVSRTYHPIRDPESGDPTIMAKETVTFSNSPFGSL